MESLDSLLASALKHAHKSKALRADQLAIKIHQQVQNAYANPLNWRTGGVVELVHRGPQGELSNLGLFQEAFYRNSSDRRLSRFQGKLAPGVAVRVEWVAGAHWLSPQPRPDHPLEETPHEILALQARFEELMESFSEELDAMKQGA